LRQLCYIICLVFLASCASYNTLDIDILKPSSYQIPSDINSIVLINNSPEQAPSTGHSSYKQDITDYPTKIRKLSTDSIQVDSTCTNLLYSMSNQLSTSMLFSEVTLGRKAFLPHVNVLNIDRAFQDYPADAMLVLESLTYQDKLTLFYYRYYDTYESELEVITHSIWTLYFDKEKNITPFRFIVSDTLYWDQNYVERSECVIEAVWHNAEKAAQYICPYWISVNRIYHTGKGSIYRNIDKNIQKNAWDKAAKQWILLFNGEKKKSLKKARMAYNMALFFEINNDLETAREWLSIAMEIFSDKQDKKNLNLCQLYDKVLENRLILQEQLNAQLGLE